MEGATKTAIIVSSTREGRFADIVAHWFVKTARERTDMAFDVIDLAEANLPARIPAGPDHNVAAFRRRVAEADAYVVITPEYNHSFPASLKQAIDLASDGWAAKPVGFVSYGGRSGGLRAVEQLRQVFPEVRATTVRDVVSFHGAWNEFGDDGSPVNASDCNAAANTMLDQLAWWANALKTARIAA